MQYSNKWCAYHKYI